MRSDSYELTVTVGNADITLNVKFEGAIHGSYRAATREDPPEYPEIEVYLEDEAELTLKNGKTIPYDLKKLPQTVRDKIQAEVEKHVERSSEDDGPDYEPDDYDYDDCDPNVDCGTDNYGRDRDYGKY